MYILLVEDDEKLGLLINHKLKQEFHTVDWAQNGKEAEELIFTRNYDLLILDWMIPQKSGLDLCYELRLKKIKTPVLMLTARETVTDRVKGLNSGADDYLVKPFSFDELFARIQALSRRKDRSWQDKKYTLGDLDINEETHEVIRNGLPLTLTRREFQLLVFLVQNAGQTLSRERILDRVWGYDVEVTPNTVDATIKLLRKKVDGPFAKKMIHSIRGLGYKILNGE